ncbi:CapA family protein [Aquabacterium sp.]|uniref:CapA family protein n=1 Tax=Aquabacterium sp. TaxID=1872578 RepID=UPI003D6D4B1F
MRHFLRHGLSMWWLTALLCGTASALAEPSEPTVSIVFVGDVMLADHPGQRVKQGHDPFAPFARILKDADVRVANLECVVARSGKPVDKPYTFRAHPRVLPLLKRNVDAVSVANNHSGDFGRQAFAEMLDRMRQTGLPFFGGGRNLSEAHEPLLIERHGLRIALLGYDEFFPRAFEAGDQHAGVAWSEDEQVARDIRRARAVHRADIVIPFMHWGEEHQPRANDRQRELARLMIDAGADAVVGTHPHVVQDTEVYRGKPIVYSLGNFIFDGFDDADNNTAWALRLLVGRGGVREASIQVGRIDRHGTPHPKGGPVPIDLKPAPPP